MRAKPGAEGGRALLAVGQSLWGAKIRFHL
jgi:hypothetical protein